MTDNARKRWTAEDDARLEALMDEHSLWCNRMDRDANSDAIIERIAEKLGRSPAGIDARIVQHAELEQRKEFRCDTPDGVVIEGEVLPPMKLIGESK